MSFYKKQPRGNAAHGGQWAAKGVPLDHARAIKVALPHELRDKLQEQADAAGMTPTELARQLLIDALTGQD